MKTNASLQLVHESETQRQHARFQMPAQALFENADYRIRDISSGGFSVAEVRGVFSPGKRIDLRLQFPFNDFFIGLTLQAEVRHYNELKRALGCALVNLTQEQTALLNHAIKSFMAGDDSALGDFISIAARDNFTKPRNQVAANAAAPSLARQLPGLLAIIMIGLVLACFIGANLYENLFTIRSLDAVVAAPVMQVKAEISGVYALRVDENVPMISKGQILGTITPFGQGSAIEIQSPCDCIITKANTASGFVSQGEAILSLAPVNARPWIIAAIDPVQARRLKANQSASISIFGLPATYKGRIISIESGLSEENASQPLGFSRAPQIKIQPDQKLPLDALNHAASVSFSTLN